MKSGKNSLFGKIDARCAYCGKVLRRAKNHEPLTKYKKGTVEWCEPCRKELDAKRQMTNPKGDLQK
jgi:hypothetical protein